MRVLVVPASRHGGTAQIGRTLATTLREEGIDVDVSQPEFMFQPGRYDGFVLGSAVYAGRWLKAARTFVEQNQEAIRAKPTWLFSSGPVGPNQTDPILVPKHLTRLNELTGARQHRQFGGRLQLSSLSRAERFVARWARITDVDRRNWDEIADWGRTIAAELTGERSKQPNGEHPREGSTT